MDRRDTTQRIVQSAVCVWDVPAIDLVDERPRQALAGAFEAHGTTVGSRVIRGAQILDDIQAARIKRGVHDVERQEDVFLVVAAVVDDDVERSEQYEPLEVLTIGLVAPPDAKSRLVETPIFVYVDPNDLRFRELAAPHAQ